LNGIFRYSDVCEDDEDVEEWTEKWKTIGEDEKLAHIQTFFRMFLSNDVTTYYYSFCRKDLEQENCTWHCIKCQTCNDWREWHCEECDKCKIYLVE